MLHPRFQGQEHPRIPGRITLTRWPKLGPAHTDITDAAPHAADAFTRLELALNDGIAAASYDGPGGGGGDGSPVERLLIGADGHLTVDQAAATMRRLDKALRELTVQLAGPTSRERWICDHAETVARIVDVWKPHSSTDRDRREVTAANIAATECKLTRDNLNLWAAVHRTSDLWGLLPEPAPVSRWVWRFAKDRGRLPSPQEWKAQRSKDDDLRAQAMATVKT